MQITINTADLLGDEKTIRDEVVEQVSSTLSKAFKQTIDSEVQKIIEKEIPSVIRGKVGELVNLHLDTLITPTDDYGKTKEPYTLRNKIAAIIASEVVFKKKDYGSDQNSFTNAVISLVESEVKKFKSEYISKVNSELVRMCMDEAAAKLKAACGIK